MKSILNHFIILSIIFIMGASNIEKPILCQDKLLPCAIANFDELYKESYNHFWLIFHEAGQRAASCSDMLRTAAFLEAASVKKGNAEFHEYFMDIIENQLILKNTKCFLEALKQTSFNSRKIILSDLNNPIYIDKSSIDNAFNRFMANPRYQEIIKFYKGIMP